MSWSLQVASDNKSTSNSPGASICPLRAEETGHLFSRHILHMIDKHVIRSEYSDWFRRRNACWDYSKVAHRL